MVGGGDYLYLRWQHIICELKLSDLLIVKLNIENMTVAKMMMAMARGEDEEAELRGAALERVAQDAQSLGVPGELEDAEHAEHAQGHEGP
ncbi:hypothetical protein CEXT_256041 [Caerostris extrusa]|uniref:Uncharacterized protein n=1 Tax=Caerostris extrusa TaxID=172846 RepID=A0AAV4RSJ9_CAEEX|nr:hypothetical protein CEXT_256041 [Caerostris extrusa]